MGSRALVAVAWSLVAACAGTEQNTPPPGAATAAPAAHPPRDEEQRPADPVALGAELDRMEARADAVIAEHAKEASGAAADDRSALFDAGARSILAAMPPVFGPANAMLYNRRAAKLGRLCAALQLAPERCEEAVRRCLDAHPELR